MEDRSFRKRVPPETFRLPNDNELHIRFAEKALLYREATILLALVYRVRPVNGVATGDLLFEPVLKEFDQIIYSAPDERSVLARLAAVTNAMEDLADRMNLEKPTLAEVPVENRKVIAAYRWSGEWFADIGHDETDLRVLALFYVPWSDLRSAVEEGLDRLVA
jgi:hypothetical protein